MNRLFKCLAPLAFLATALALAAPSASAAPQLGVALSYEANEVQRVDVTATSGQFRLNFGSGGPGVSETGDLEFNASEAEVEGALNALANISAGGGSVSVTKPGAYEVTFDGGPLRNTDVPELSAVDGTTALSGSVEGRPPGVLVRTELSGGVRHSDERVDFIARVKNEAPPPGPPSVGDPLTCVTSNFDWLFDEEVRYRFQFRWLRDGVPLGPWAAADTVSGKGERFELTTYISRYTVKAADAESAIQCLVKGTNPNPAETGSIVVASQPALVANPQPAVAPPTPNDPTAPSGRPELSGPAEWTAGNKLKCTAPTTGWSTSNEASPISWSFEWLRDGEPAPGTVTPASATESEYELTAEDVSAPAAPAVFQCIATATNAGGHTAVVESPEYQGKTQYPAPEFSYFGLPRSNHPPTAENAVNSTAGPVTLELELPSGEQTSAYKFVSTFHENPTDWDCEALPASGTQPARARCGRGEPLGPEGEYPPLKVIAALGADAPDLATPTATAFGGGAPLASDQLQLPIEPALPFGLSKWTAPLLDAEGNEYTQAGGHPLLGESRLVPNRKRVLGSTEEQPVEELKQLFADLPPGTIGNPSALPALCPAVGANPCPDGSQVGFIQVTIPAVGANMPIYAAEPAPGHPADLFFSDFFGRVFTLTPRLRPAEGYAISLEVAPAPEVELIEAKTTLCGFGAKPGTDECYEPGEPGAFPKPFITAPTRCGVPITTPARLNSWTDATFVEATPFHNATIEGCDKVPFEPKIKVVPTTNLADAPAGLKAELTMPAEGLEKGSECHQTQGDESSPLAPECLSESHLRNVEVTLPKGLTVNPSGANGLEACSEAQIGISDSGVPNGDPASCPTASRIGSVEVITPLLKKPLDGAVYQAEQNNNPFHSTIAIYVLAEDAERGVRLKLPGKVELDPQTGQLTSTFTDTPQQPFKRFKLEFFGGATAPLKTPETCGTYSTESVLTPWSGGASVSETNSYAINASPGSEEGSGGGECATSPAAMTNAPEFDAGTVTPVAGAYSPFVVRLSRQDGSQRFSAIDVTPPPGLTAKLAGTPPCPEAAIATAEAKTGHEEEAHPSCPAASHVGTVHVATGAGPAPYWATGQVYLAGPYKGAPLSFAIITPAVAGPFDLGTVVTKTALRVDPASAQITATSDPIPQMLDGIPLDVRTVAIAIDKPNFTLNGTSCAPLAISGQAISPLGSKAPLSERFQLGECARLGFKPKLSLRLFGGTHRADYEGLRAVLRARGGDANIGRAAVTLPHAAFLAQSHIRTICTRVQFAADQCPPGSVYGHAEATSPILDYQLEGAVYLRSNPEHELPDLVAKLRGPSSQPIEIDLAGRTDSAKGALRNTFEVVPDAPVSKFTLELFGGKRGLVELSTDNYCARVHRATVELGAQNGRERVTRPAVRNSHCGKQRKKRHHRRCG